MNEQQEPPYLTPEEVERLMQEQRDNEKPALRQFIETGTPGRVLSNVAGGVAAVPMLAKKYLIRPKAKYLDVNNQPKMPDWTRD